MFHSTRSLWAVLMIGGVALFTGAANGQDKRPSAKHDASALNLALRDVINTGAKLYNDNGDHAGCFRMYQGSLLAVKPFVAPDLQKKIDAGIAKCDQLGSYADRADELRKVLDEIRERTKAPAETKEPPASTENGEVAGKVVFDGKPVAGGYSVSLLKNGKKISTVTQNDGSFRFKMPVPVGEYRVVVEATPEAKGPALPPRYGASASTTDLTIWVRAGPQQVDLSLVK